MVRVKARPRQQQRNGGAQGCELRAATDPPRTCGSETPATAGAILTLIPAAGVTETRAAEARPCSGPDTAVYEASGRSAGLGVPPRPTVRKTPPPRHRRGPPSSRRSGCTPFLRKKRKGFSLFSTERHSSVVLRFLHPTSHVFCVVNVAAARAGVS